MISITSVRTLLQRIMTLFPYEHSTARPG